jgi:mandelamide amidase
MLLFDLITFIVGFVVFGACSGEAAEKKVSKATESMTQDQMVRLSAAEAARLIKCGALSSTALTKALLARVEQYSDLHAFITVNAKEALAAAAAADRRGKGQRKGLLYGVPLVIKDNTHVAKLPNTAGTPGLKNYVPKKNAPVIQALVDEGAIILGKTNMHELAFGIRSNNAGFGVVANPYDTTLSPGGSSGGTGSAVAALLAPAGLGTDTGGSVRVPAALCGLAGLRPTLKRYSQEAITPIASTRDTAGPMARTVEDLVLLDSAITKDRSSVVPADLREVKLGIPKDYWADVDNESAALARSALERLRKAGVILVDVNMDSIRSLNDQVGFPVAFFEGNKDIKAYLAKYVPGLTLDALAKQIASPDVFGTFRDFIIDGAPKATPAAVYEKAVNALRPQLKQQFADLFKQNGIDAIIFPTTPLPATKIIGSDETVDVNGKPFPTFPTYIRNEDPGSNAGSPGITVPLALTAVGLPVGLGLDGPEGSDRRLLSLGLALERVFGRIPEPLLP